MPAQKADTVHFVDRAGDRIHFVSRSGNLYTVPIGEARKTQLVVACSHEGIRFGQPPLSVEVEVLRAALRAGRHIPVPTTSSSPRPEPTPSAPAPTPSVPTPSPTPSAGAWEVLSGVVRNLTNKVSDLADKVAVIADRLADLRSAHEATDAKVANLASEVEAVKAMQPKVTSVTIGTMQPKTITGTTHEAFPSVLRTIAARNAAWLVGPAGTGKSTIAEQCAEALGLDFHAESLSAATSEYKFLGFRDANSHYEPTAFRRLFENGGVFCLDEVDSANPNVLTVLNTALANGRMAFPDGMVKKHDDFVIVATANTIGNGATTEYLGRNPIDKATIDRFVFHTIGIDLAVEDSILAAVGLPSETADKWKTIVRTARRNAETYGLRVIVSPRAMKHGARLLAVGASFQEAVDGVIVKGADKATSEKLLTGIAI